MRVDGGLFSNDFLFGGRLICRQFRHGYRFSVDAILAAHFLRPQPGDAILDLGCGCGIISLILAYRHPDVRIAGLEVQDELAALAAENVIANGMSDRIAIVHGDLRRIDQYAAAESFEAVICNPPYGRSGHGRISPRDQRARARHELDAELDDIVRAASYAVKNRGSVVVVYPAGRAAAVIATMKGERLEPKRLQPVYAYPESPAATLVLVEAVKNAGEGVQIPAPLYIYRKRNGLLTEAVHALYE